MWWRSLLVVSLFMVIIGGNLLIWQQRSASTTPAAAAAQTDTAVVTSLYPGGSPPATLPEPRPQTNTHEGTSSGDLAEGQRLFAWYNCNTCHANGGGAIGPALMDNKWIYGSEPKNIYESILEGRPNGMPSFRGKIPDQQVWQLVSYIRSMSGLVPKSIRSSRADHMSVKKPDTLLPKGEPKKASQPPTDAKAGKK